MLGGKRRKTKHKEGQKVLLDAIWSKCGGPAAVAKKLGVNPQDPINWRNRGGAPLIDCPHIAETLDVPLYGLNYEELYVFYKTEIPEWTDTVKLYKLNPSIENKILSLKEPQI